MKDKEQSIYNSCANFIHLWSHKLSPDEDQPLIFSDKLSFILFSSDLVKLVNFFYKKGRRDYRRQRSLKAIKKFNKIKMEE